MLTVLWGIPSTIYRLLPRVLITAEERTGEQVQPVFLSIDPERDSVKQVKAYVAEFHPRLLGLTGTNEQVCGRGRRGGERREMGGMYPPGMSLVLFTAVRVRMVPCSPLPRHGLRSSSAGPVLVSSQSDVAPHPVSVVQCMAAARAYRVYYSKTAESTDDYLVDHSIITYLLDPEGAFLSFYGKNMEAPEVAQSIAGHIQGWRERHGTADTPAPPSSKA